jgi:hypothetical protein
MIAENGGKILGAGNGELKMYVTTNATPGGKICNSLQKNCEGLP